MKIEIFGKQNCGFCTSAKTLLETKNIEYDYTDFFTLDEEGQSDIQTNRAPTARTFPIIFIDEIYIGGFTNLESILK